MKQGALVFEKDDNEIYLFLISDRGACLMSFLRVRYRLDGQDFV